ncbi:MAG: SUMF1/EgtB/PvdO family nonheme iron enzyme, partial [bacterium]
SLWSVSRVFSQGQEDNGMIFIPAGEFVMGSRLGDTDEQPEHKVILDSYYINKNEVTNAEYKKFVDATKHKVPYFNKKWASAYNWNPKTRMYPRGKKNYPVVLVTWQDASAYAKWAGKRLPTEAEWEKAARGDQNFIFPWGNAWDINKLNAWIKVPQFTKPVGSYEAGKSPYGCYDMAGNVWEWCSDWYDENSYKSSPAQDPKGPAVGKAHTVRGGSWGSEQWDCRTTARLSGEKMLQLCYVGFRCAKDAK